MVDDIGKCPLCGKLIDVSPGLKSCVCPACGQRVLTSAAIAYRNSADGGSVASKAMDGQYTAKTPARATTVTTSKPTATKMTPTEKPSQGAVFGVFILCWFVACGTCATVSLLGGFMAGSVLNGSALGDFYRYAGIYSTGGFLTLAFSIVAAMRYSENSDLGRAVGLAFSSGIVIGLIVVAVAPIFITLRWG